MGKTRNIKLIYLHGSQGIEIPDSILKKYGFSDSLILEETEEGILIRKQE